MINRHATTRPRHQPTPTAVRVALLTTLLAVAACSAAGPGATTSPAAPTTSPAAPITSAAALSATPPPAEPSVQPTRVPARTPVIPPSTAPGKVGLPDMILDPVIADIAGKAGVPIDQVTIVSAESVTFPDGSLGCPVPGNVYIQVLVDGYKIVAEAGGKTYDYRGSGPGRFRQCDRAG